MAAGDLISQVRAARRVPTPAVARAVRQAAGLSQAQIASALGVDRVTVTRWEAGLRKPRGRVARAYSNLIGRLQAEVAAS